MNIVYTKIVQEFSCLQYAGTKRSFNEVLKFVSTYRLAQFYTHDNSMTICFGLEGYTNDYSIGLKKGDWICKQKFSGRNFVSSDFFTLTNQEFRGRFLPL